MGPLGFLLVLLAAQEVDIKVDVRVVRVAAAVVDPDGKHITGLAKEDFRIKDSGVPQDVRYLWRESDLPLTVALVLDTSGSQMAVLRQNKKVIHEFLKKVLKPQDKAFLATFDRTTRLDQDLTSSVRDLSSALDDVSENRHSSSTRLGEPCAAFVNQKSGRRSGCGGSIVWNAVFYSAQKLYGLDGRKAILLLSDGIDTGSDRSFDMAIKMAQASEASVYAIGQTGHRNEGLNLRGLYRLANETGGVPFLRVIHSKQVFQRINEDLRGLYVLGYSPEKVERCDGKFHTLEVETTAGHKVRARRGYYAPKEACAN